MKKYLIGTGVFVVSFFLAAYPAFAASSTISNYTNTTVQLLTLIASSAAVFFLIKGGYSYITSSGRPEALSSAKKTMMHAVVGLLLVLSASFLISLLMSMLPGGSVVATSSSLHLSDISLTTPSDGLTQVLIDAVSGFLQNLIQTATQPLVDSIFTFLTTTPDMLTNSVIRNFWLTMLGITDSLFIIVVALLGLHVMSADTFGFEQAELKQVLPRIGLAFLGANMSLFLCNYVVVTANALTTAVIDATGGLNEAWITNALNVHALMDPQTVPLIILLFLIIFLILSMFLLFLFVGRLIVVSLGAVISPFLFLLWTIPKFADVAEIAGKAYIAAVFTIFIQVIIMQLAASFLTYSGTSGNSLMGIVTAIGLFFVLLKVPQMLTQFVFYTSGIRSIHGVGNSIMNILTSENSSSVSRRAAVDDAKESEE